MAIPFVSPSLLPKQTQGTVMDVYRVLQRPSPATLASAFPGFAMATYSLSHQGWSAPFRELVAFLAIEVGLFVG